MAPLSVLPGRLRFESNDLIGNKEGCHVLEDGFLSVHGVNEASASYRTGRILVRFDESLVTRGEIEAHLGRALQAAATQKERGSHHSSPIRRSTASRGASSSGVGHFMMEMALHAFLPAPLDLLLPTAATVFRR